MDTAYPLVNAGLMQSFVGRQASLFGRYEGLEAAGRLMKVKTTDGSVVVAVVTAPLSGPVEAGSCVWMDGTVENRNKFKPSVIRIIPAAMCESLDEGIWNDLIALLAEHPELSYEGLDDTLEHFGVEELNADGSNADIIPFPDQDVAQAAANGKDTGADQFNDSDQFMSHF